MRAYQLTCRSRLEREQEIARKHAGCAHAAQVHSFVKDTFSHIAAQHGEQYQAASPIQPITSKGRASLENTDYIPRQGPTTPIIERRLRQEPQAWHAQELQLKRHTCACTVPMQHIHVVSSTTQCMTRQAAWSAAKLHM